MTDDKLKKLPLTRHLPKASVICHLEGAESEFNGYDR
jgi:hypothetical protein